MSHKDIEMENFTNETSKEVFEMTYCLDNETPEDVWKRVSKTMASVETEKEKWESEFYDLLTGFKFVPGGRILSNAGTDHKGTTLINCFVSGQTSEDMDSMTGIMNELKNQATILKSEGGYGVYAGFIRPRGSYISGTGGHSPGPIKMLEMWDKQSEVITSGAEKGEKEQRKGQKKKIRKGAQMVTFPVWHPDIEEFIRAKQTPGRLTKFNMSVLLTDAFMNAVKGHHEWNLIYPDISHDPEKYRKEWNGNMNNWTGKVKIHKTYEDASDLFDLITESTYNRNEPGVLFVDRINEKNNLNLVEQIHATNPCGEQILPIGGVCLLGSINLPTLLTKKEDGSYVLLMGNLAKTIQTAVRFLDNVNDITYVPLPENVENMKQKRRIGLGIMGYGSALLMLGLRYGSEEALAWTENLMYTFRVLAYNSSIALGKEKGSFPLFEQCKNSNETYQKCEFLRNSHLLSIQPTGNTSTASNLVSSGIEPLFCYSYTRTKINPDLPDSLTKPTNVNFSSGTCDHHEDWEWVTEGDTNLLRSKVKHDGSFWKIDENRGYLKEVLVEDYAVRLLKQEGKWDENADHVVCASSGLSVDDHVKTLNVFAKYVCSAISKTINVPNDYPYDDFKNVYMSAWELGNIKGLTTYRAGTMASVLSTGSVTKKERVVEERPETLECDIHMISEYTKEKENVKWIVLVGLLNDTVYEVFAFRQKDILLLQGTKGYLTKCDNGKYTLKTDAYEIRDIGSRFENTEQTALTRMISFTLRNGSPIEKICEQLYKSEVGYGTFCSSLIKTLSTYVRKGIRCPKCKKDTVAIEEGCFNCKDCGYSKCS